MGLNKITYELSGVHTEGNSASAVKEPGLGWMTGFLFLVCFVGLFVLIPLRKVYIYVTLKLFSSCSNCYDNSLNALFVQFSFLQVMIVDLKLTYPSGLATAVLINGFHTQGDKMAK